MAMKQIYTENVLQNLDNCIGDSPSSFFEFYKDCYGENVAGIRMQITYQ